MAFNISRLKIVVKTVDGDYGVDIPFKKGLFILRVENTHGKSTCMNAIAYALGMEKSLGLGGAKLPFPPSLTKKLEIENKKEISVISSYVLLEIENDRGDTATLKRQIIGSSDENNIDMFECPIDNIIPNQKQTLFLYKEGDTTRDLGFFKWLSDFIAWKIPLVPNHEGKEIPLYPSILFPTWFVEQKKGWASIQATTPLFLGVKDPKKRALEFIISLDINKGLKRKNEIKNSLDEINDQWSSLYKRAEFISAKVSGFITNLNDRPDAKFDQAKVDVMIKKLDEWVSIHDLLSQEHENLKHININSKLDNVDFSFEEKIQERIVAYSDDINKLNLKHQDISDELSYITYQLESTEKRITTLTEDKRKYEDLKKISTQDVFPQSSILSNTCPTCGQSYSDNLVDMSKHNVIMTYEQSLFFIKEQIKAVQFVHSDYIQQIKRKKIEQSDINNEIVRLRFSIKKMVESAIPSISLKEEEIREKILLENKIKEYETTIVDIFNIKLALDSLHKKYLALIKERNKIPATTLSILDVKKIKHLQTTLRDLLSKYGFSSFDPELIEISHDSLLPTREGYDIGFDASASDGIRIIWSYLISLFELGHHFETNHPNIVVFDEPRQQEANKFSFTELLKSASQICKNGGQIILATSEEEDALVKALEGEEYNLVAFDKADGKIIRKLA
ncbi:hypothetical protein [Yersinia kristensenii]|uniref:hypothetical protein n=1 Tax=Yersinia kristensenii TaxID=28152 RepID=UPI0022FEBEC7|nr:hypothetical protein [Yersinia kristensenii]MDA5487878.1 hypothetical protein [Yersinia kristensenii]